MDDLSRRLAWMQASQSSSASTLASLTAAVVDLQEGQVQVAVEEVSVPRVLAGASVALSVVWPKPFQSSDYQLIPIVGSTLVGRLAISAVSKSKTGAQVTVANVGLGAIAVNTGAVYLVAIEQP